MPKRVSNAAQCFRSTFSCQGWSNFLFTSNNATDILRFRAATGPALFNVEGTFFSNRQLRSDAPERWKTLYQQTLEPMLMNSTLFGVFLGDELAWQCISLANISTAANMIKASFATLPANTTAIVYQNEAYPVLTDSVDSCNGTVDYQVPTGLDLISLDYYPDEGLKIHSVDLFRRLAAKELPRA